MIAALNSDIQSEIRMADECMRRASAIARPYGRFLRQIVRCAASSQSNATALAAEVIALGGHPPAGRPRWRETSWIAGSIEHSVAEAQRLLLHYKRRLAMAKRCGMPRLREVFRDIIATKRAHLEHAALVAAAAERPTQLS